MDHACFSDRLRALWDKQADIQREREKESGRDKAIDGKGEAESERLREKKTRRQEKPREELGIVQESVAVSQQPPPQAEIREEDGRIEDRERRQRERETERERYRVDLQWTGIQGMCFPCLPSSPVGNSSTLLVSP